MATYTWSVPAGKEITGTTKIKDTDNHISDTITDLVDFVNGAGAHLNQGLTFDFVDKASQQTITAIKTHTAQIKGITPVSPEDLVRKDYVDNAISALLDAAPGTLDTLNELAAALGDDPNFSTTITNLIATKIGAANYASSTIGGTVKMRLDGTTLYITNDGTNA